MTTKNGQVFSDCENVRIDKNKYSASLYSGDTKVSSLDNGNYTTLTVRKGTKLTVRGTNTLFCSKYTMAYTYE